MTNNMPVYIGQVGALQEEVIAWCLNGEICGNRGWNKNLVTHTGRNIISKVYWEVAWGM